MLANTMQKFIANVFPNMLTGYMSSAVWFSYSTFDNSFIIAFVSFIEPGGISYMLYEMQYDSWIEYE